MFNRNCKIVLGKMATYFVCVFIVTVCINVVSATANTAEDYQSNINTPLERPVGRAYSLSSCDYQRQVGYSCLTCHRALHCYPGNAAILVDCYGLFRFCRDGRCSRNQGDKCFSDTKLTTPSAFDGVSNNGGAATARDAGPVIETVILPLDPKDNMAVPESTNSDVRSWRVDKNIV